MPGTQPHANITIAIVEDKVHMADVLVAKVKEIGYEVLWVAESYTKAIDLLSERQPDLVLLDIDFKVPEDDADGIELASLIRMNYPMAIIILTEKSDAVTIEKAKKVNPDAYLLKPCTKSILYSTIEIAVARNVEVKENPEYLFVKDGYLFVKVLFKQILYIVSEDNYLRFQLESGRRVMVRSTIKKMLEQVESKGFYRINRSMIVNIDQIDQIDTDKLKIKDMYCSIDKKHRDGLLATLHSNGKRFLG